MAAQAQQQKAQKETAPAPSILEEVIKETVESTPVSAGFGTKDGFELMLRQAKWLASSNLVPQQFQNNIANSVIALEMANRLGASPLSVMQNLYIVQGKPGWSAQFIIAAVNSTGKFTPIRYTVTGTGDDKTCIAWANEKSTGERLESPPVSIAMAKAEGWLQKNGSKWKNMPELMLRYRTATLFGRLYAPEVLMGIKTVDEIEDIGPEKQSPEAEIAAHANRQEIDIEPPQAQPEPAEPPPISEEEKAAIVAEETAAAEEPGF